MGERIAIIQGHPDPRGNHFCHALAAAYAQAAREGGHEVETIEVAHLDFPLLRSAAEWQGDLSNEGIHRAQRTIARAGHLVVVFPLWLGDMPALLKGFFEQVLRPGFAIDTAEPGRLAKKLLKGKSARILVTMGMPAFFYRLYYRAHSVRSLQRNVLEFCGFGPVRTSLVGTVESKARGHREIWLAKVAALGREAA